MHSSLSLRWKIGCSYINTWLESSNWQAWTFSGMQLKASWTMRHWLYRMLLLSLVCVGVLNGQDPIHALHRARLAPAACRTGISWISCDNCSKMDSNDASGKRFVPPKLSNSWLVPPPQQQTYFHQTNTPGKQKWGRSVAHLDGPVPFYPSSRNQKISFQGWLLRRCYFAIDRGFTNAKWLLRLYQRTLEGSDRAFLVTPWKGGVGGLDMFFHPPLDHYKLYLNDTNWPVSQEWTDFEAAGGATRLSDGHFSNHWGITPLPGGQWNNPIPCDWGEPPDRRIFLDYQLISWREYFEKAHFFKVSQTKVIALFGEGPEYALIFFWWSARVVPWCHQLNQGMDFVSLRSFLADAPIFSRYVRQSPQLRVW